MTTDNVLELINKNTLVIFSATYCPHCKEVRRLMDEIQDDDLKEQIKDKNIIELDMLDSDELKESLKEYTKCRTIPQVFIKGKFIGGCSDIRKLIDENKLKEKFM